ncbi:MAG: MFS transporter [Candidatus Thorarchaeota archaeon]
MITSEEKHYPVDLYVLILSSLVVFMAVEMTRPIIPLHVTDMGATTFELGLIVGILSATWIILKIPLGIISERFAGVYVIILAIFGQSLSQYLYSIAPSYVWFYPIQVLHAISTAALVPMAISVSQNLAPKGKSGEIMGVFLTSYGLANSIGPLFSSYLLTFMSYIQVFQVATFVPLLGILPLFALKKTKSLTKPIDSREKNPMASLSHIFHSRNLMILTFLRFAYAITYAFYITLFVVYAENVLLLVPSLIAFLFGSRGLSDMLLRIPAGRLVDKVDYKWMIITACGVLSLVYILLVEITNFYLLFGVMIVFGLSVGLRVVSEWTMLADQSRANARNVAAAYLSTVFNVGSTVGAVLAGILATLFDIVFVFRFAGVLMFITFLMAFLITDRDKTIIVNENSEKKI